MNPPPIPESMLTGKTPTVEEPNPQSQPVENATPAETPPPSPPEAAPAPDVETLIAEAEERGYLRGRNEAIERLMAKPSDVDPTLADLPAPDDSATGVLILNTYRPSVWE